jgi:hypothetical protein
MVMRRWWNALEPRQRTRAGRPERCEAPVEDGGHVAGSAEVSSEGGCLQVQEGVLLGFGREGEQVCPLGWPGGFSGESGDELVDSIEFCHNLGSDELMFHSMQSTPDDES